MPLDLPARFGPYEVRAPLGAGGMGEVYRAVDTRLGREVALKILPPEVARDPDRLRRFEQEARSASALNHPAIVTLHDVGVEEGQHFLVMELVDGQDLRRALSAGALPLRKALALASQVAEGLAAAHARGIVHRDLKPENVMVTAAGHAKILDFGLAKAAPALVQDEATAPLHAVSTEPGIVLGTAGYLAPEQAKGLEATPASDQFAFGALLYEMLSGERAFRKPSVVETLAAIIQEEPARLPAPAVPPPLAWVVERCLSKDPRDRYADTRDLALDLARLRERLGGREDMASTDILARVPAPDARGVRRPGPGRGAAGLLAAAALAAGTGLGLLLPARRAAAPVQRFLTFSGEDGAPAFAPDGRTLAFVSSRTGRPCVWIKQFPKGEEAVLTQGPDAHPRFTPDGTQILFNRLREGGHADLYRVSALGGEPRLVLKDALQGEPSPDGRALAFLRARPGPGGISGMALMVADAAGSGARELGWSSGLARGAPRWSPDGRTLAVSSQPEGSFLAQPWRLELYPAAGGAPRLLQPPARLGALSCLVWTRDGKLLYSQTEGLIGSSAGQVILQDPSNGRWEVLLHGLAVGPVLDLSPEGEVVMEAWLPRSNLRRVEAGEAGPWLTLGICADRQPAVSRDGRRIVFSSNRDGNLDLWELQPGSGRLRRLTDDASADWDPAYSPDGERLFWSSDRTGRYEIWTALADGSEARALTTLGWDAENPNPSPDGRWFLFGAYDTAHFGVWRMDLDGGGLRQLWAGTVAAPPQLSPDGTAFTVGALAPDGALQVLVLDSGTGSERGRIVLGKVPAAASEAVTGRSRWTPDGRGIVLAALDAQARPVLVAVPSDRPGAGARRVLFTPPPGQGPESFTVLPGEQGLVVALQERARNLLRITGLPVRPPRRR